MAPTTLSRKANWFRIFKSSIRTFAALALIAITASSSLAQLPTTQLTTISPSGGKQGATFDVTTKGLNQDDVTQLLFSHPGIKAVGKTAPPTEFRKSAKPIPSQFTVTIAADVPTGVYEVRAIGRFGASNPRAFVVDNLAEVAEAGANTVFATPLEVALGSVVNGQVAGSSVDYFKVTLKKGQRVLIDCWAERIDSRLDGILVLYDPEGKELVRCRDYIGRDPFIDFTAPADGSYTIGLNDFIYTGSAEYFYRLRIHSGPKVDFIFPPSGLTGSNSQYTLYGRNLPGGKPVAGLILQGTPLEAMPVNIALPGDEKSRRSFGVATIARPQEVLLDNLSYQLETSAGATNSVAIYYSDSPVVQEKEGNNTPALAQKVAVPCEVVGQFYPKRDEDWFQFSAKKGAVYYIDLISHRLGLQTDPLFLIQKVTKNAKGEEVVTDITYVDDPGDRNGRIGSDFDTSTDDPSYRFAVPEDAEYRIMVRDQFSSSRNDPRLVYRLSIRTEKPDFRLVALPQALIIPANQVLLTSTVLRKGGATLVTMRIDRRDGFNEEIQLYAEGLPAGVTCAGAIVAPGAKTATLVFSAADSAAAWAGPIRILGKATLAGKEIIRQARGGSPVWNSVNRTTQPVVFRGTRDFVLAVTDKEMHQAEVKAGDGAVLVTSLGGKIDLPIKVARREGFKGDLKLVATGLPKEVKPADLTIKGDAAEGKLAIAITNAKAKPGIYTFYLRSDTKIKHVRNPDAIKTAEAEQKEVEAILKQRTDKVAKDTAVKDVAVKAAQATTATMKQAEQANATAVAAAKDAATKAKQASDKLQAAIDVAAKEPNNKVLVDAAAAAKKAVDATTAKSTEMSVKMVAAANKVLVDAQAKNKAALDVQVKAEAVLKLAQATVVPATAAKKAADTNVVNVKKANVAKDLTIAVISTPIKLRVVATPMSVASQMPASIKQGAKTQIPVTITRLYGFTDTVDITFTPPKGIAGVTAAKVNIPKDKTQGTLELVIAANAPVGKHTVTIQVQGKFNNIAVTATQQVVVNVEKAAVAK